MKKLIIVVLTIFLAALTGCSILKPKDKTSIVTEAPAVIMTDAPAATDAPLVETEAPVEITHVDIPDFSQYNIEQKIDDCNTGERFSLGSAVVIGAGCDSWDTSKIERPIEGPGGLYFPEADIIHSEMGTNQFWYFAKIDLYKDAKGKIPADLTAGLELDPDIDSRGEFLILVTGLASTKWSVGGVSVWQDTDGDVGGEKPQEPDPLKGNGYDKLLFESGIGDDPDLAWARIDPVTETAVEIAFKVTLLPADGKFAWWTWTSLAGLDSAKMEVVDQLEPATTWKMDNTCGWIYGAKPSKVLINICDFILPTATPAPTPTPSVCQPPANGCPRGTIWNQQTCQCIKG